MSTPLVSVIETPTYLADARKLLTEEERAAIVDLVAAAPECGDLIQGGGGIRKVRVPVAGRGKRGGARLIYFFHSTSLPIFLLAIFAKNQRANVSAAEIKALAKVVKDIGRNAAS